MMGNFFRWLTDHKQQVNKKQKLSITCNKQNTKLDTLREAEAKGSTRNMLASLGLRLMQHCQFWTSVFSVKNNFWGKIFFLQYFQFFTVHIVNIHNNHQHMHTFSFDTIKL